MTRTGANQTVVGWGVVDEETLSDHRAIAFEYGTRPTASGKRQRREKTELGQVGKSFVEELSGSRVTPESVHRAARDAYRKCTPRVTTNDQDSLPYWWSLEIQSKIKEARCKRREYQRERGVEGRETAYAAYKEAKRHVKKLIRRAKTEAWKSMCRALKDDVYGDAYQIVRRQMKAQGPRV